MSPRKSFLLTGTAMSTAALLALNPPEAMAAEKLKLNVGGYMEQFFGYTSQNALSSGDFSGFDVKSDTEIFFSGEVRLDNGIEVRVHVQLEGNTSGDQIDESYLEIDGAFGRVVVGGENSAMYLMHAAPKSFGFGLNSGDNVEWLSFDGVGGNTGVFRGAFGSTAIEPARVNDANRLTYLSPRFSGFQFGASYVPDSREDSNGKANSEADLHDGATVAAGYSGKLGGASIKASAGYGLMRSGDGTTDPDPEAFNFGLSVGVGNWTLASAYAVSIDDSSVGDMSGYTVGLNYTPGPWKVGLSAFIAERDGSPTANAGGVGAREANYDTVQLEGSYALGPGISAVGVLGYADLDDQSAFGTDSEAVYAVGVMRLSF